MRVQGPDREGGDEPKEFHDQNHDQNHDHNGNNPLAEA